MIFSIEADIIKWRKSSILPHKPKLIIVRYDDTIDINGILLMMMMMIYWLQCWWWKVFILLSGIDDVDDDHSVACMLLAQWWLILPTGPFVNVVFISNDDIRWWYGDDTLPIVVGIHIFCVLENWWWWIIPFDDDTWPLLFGDNEHWLLRWWFEPIQ